MDPDSYEETFSEAPEIELSSRKCIRLFENCRSVSFVAKHGWIEYRELEFFRWTEVAQVYQSQTSLDYRLKDRPEIRKRILNILDGISEALAYCLYIGKALTGKLPSVVFMRKLPCDMLVSFFSFPSLSSSRLFFCSTKIFMNTL